MNDYISREAAIAEFSESQELARKRAYDTPTNSPAYMRYVTQAQERDSAVRRLMAIPAADVVEKEKYDRLLENSLIVSAALQEYQKADVVELDRAVALEHALLSMIYQFCQDGDGCVHHLWMEATEEAFGLLGIANYTSVSVIESLLAKMDGGDHDAAD